MALKATTETLAQALLSGWHIALLLRAAMLLCPFRGGTVGDGWRIGLELYN
ncbi:hypothetical protein [Deinococcus ruber]|uniref:Uncharacterized protein n=1 Tax=Deinococcus ruber TaxID=1848197 RepID=A0A918FJ31_9DEIO|nr:hypothetical protein [Deinococcus ruber]GGR41537.1 hypothetical protein GCM10008957_56750 [Deinococcus ruber]